MIENYFHHSSEMVKGLRYLFASQINYTLNHGITKRTTLTVAPIALGGRLCLNLARTTPLFP